MLTVADIFEALTHTRPTAPQIISEAAVDSRQVIPAALFVALEGEQQDGHLYVNDAFRRGAQAVLIEKEIKSQYPIIDLRNNQLPEIMPSFDQPVALLVGNSLDALQKIAAFWRKKLNIRVIGITGSVGKSTTKELIAEVLSQKFRTLKNIGNLNNEIGLPLTILRMTENHQRAVLEMGFYVPGEIAFLCDLAQPSVSSEEKNFRGRGVLAQRLEDGERRVDVARCSAAGHHQFHAGSPCCLVEAWLQPSASSSTRRRLMRSRTTSERFPSFRLSSRASNRRSRSFSMARLMRSSSIRTSVLRAYRFSYAPVARARRGHG